MKSVNKVTIVELDAINAIIKDTLDAFIYGYVHERIHAQENEFNMYIYILYIYIYISIYIYIYTHSEGAVTRIVLQNIFRNLKGHSLCMNFLTSNETFFIENRKKLTPLQDISKLNSINELQDEELILIRKTDKMFEGIFTILNMFCKNNRINLK